MSSLEQVMRVFLIKLHMLCDNNRKFLDTHSRMWSEIIVSSEQIYVFRLTCENRCNVFYCDLRSATEISLLLLLRLQLFFVCFLRQLIIFISSLYFSSDCMKSTDKPTTASTVYIHTLSKLDNRTKVVKFSAADLWSQNYKIRINNMNDRSKKINSEKEIRNQVRFVYSK